MIKLTRLAVPLDYDAAMLKDLVSKRLGIETEAISEICVEKRAVNTKNKLNICFEMIVIVTLLEDENAFMKRHKKDLYVTKVAALPEYESKYGHVEKPPVVIGCGPAGLFAALILAEAGTNPILIERGQDVVKRKEKVLKFWETGVLDEASNVQFGEGGAGTFSDGKLKIGKKDARKMKVLRELVEAGAPEEIMYLSMPHIGTDLLSETVQGIRKKIISLGGEVRFETKVETLIVEDHAITGVVVLSNGRLETLYTNHVVLAIGNSARDTFKSLQKSGVRMVQKPIAVGVRIEHPQKLINEIKYGEFASHSALSAADYKMVVHLENGRGVYTFCMCPGGTVVAATSEANAVVTNGMSEFARDGKNANTALLVTIEAEDLQSDDPLAGMYFQQQIEAAAFIAGGGDYKAPVQRLDDFLNRRPSTCFGDVHPSYLPGTKFAPVESYLPNYVAESLREAIIEMGLWMPGFNHADAVITGAETRSASPVRITRDASCEAVGIKGLYPCGEGAGYAGGIISAAADGVQCAEQILIK